MDLDEPVTLYNPQDGAEVVSSTRAEVVRLRAAGYRSEPPAADEPQDEPTKPVAEKSRPTRRPTGGDVSTSGGDSGDTGSEQG